MSHPNNHESARRRVRERFETVITEEGLSVQGPMTAEELMSQYGGQVEAISQEAFRHQTPEAAREWVERCIQDVGFRAVVLANQQGDVAGFTWGAPLHENSNGGLEADVTRIESARRAEEANIDNGDVVYSSALAITPELRGRGLGSGLALAAIQLCREQLHSDGALLLYRTYPGNQPAIRASEALGAERTDVVSPITGKQLWAGYLPPFGTDRGE